MLCVHFNQRTADLLHNAVRFFESLGGKGSSRARSSKAETDPVVEKAKALWLQVERLPIAERRQRLDAAQLDVPVSRMLFERETVAFREYAGLLEQTQVFDVPTLEKAREFYSARSYQLFLPGQAEAWMAANPQPDAEARLRGVLKARENGMHPDLSDALLVRHFQLRSTMAQEAEAKYPDDRWGTFVQDEATAFWQVFSSIKPLTARKAVLDEFLPHLHPAVADYVGLIEKSAPVSASEAERSVAAVASAKKSEAKEFWTERCAHLGYPELRSVVDSSPVEIRRELQHIEIQVYAHRPSMDSAESLRAAASKDRNQRHLTYEAFTDLMDHARTLPTSAAPPP